MKTPPRKSVCGHLSPVLSLRTRKTIITNLYNLLKPRADEFDAIVISGYSMALIGPIIAHKLNKNIVIVRKESDTRHSYYDCEGEWGQRCLMIDDLMDSGNTLNYVRGKIKGIDCELVGIALWCSSSTKEYLERVHKIEVFTCFCIDIDK